MYGLGLIGEEKYGCFRTYHFDYRGSTVALTDESGCITDTFQYDTYGKLISRTGNSFVIFGYNGRDGVITDRNGLIYMRARYYSPELRRFINADIVKGEITNAITLNRYAYANGNPVSNVDPFGLSAERGDVSVSDIYSYGSLVIDTSAGLTLDALEYAYMTAEKPDNIGVGIYNKQLNHALANINKAKGYAYKGSYVLAGVGVFVETGENIYYNVQDSETAGKIIWDATVDVVILGTNAVTSTAVGMAIGSMIPVPVLGTLVDAAGGYLVGVVLDSLGSRVSDEMKKNG